MKKYLWALMLALFFAGCTNQKEVKIPSTADRLFDGISAFSEEIVLDDDAESVHIAFAELLCADASLFYVKPQYRYSVRGEQVVFFPEYTMSEDEAEAYTDALYRRADALSEGIDESLPVADKALLLHDRLLQTVEYDKKHTFPLADALLAGRADCEGYARAYQLLLQRCGINALFVTGESHAWVMLCDEDGIWYHADPTWDDGAYLSHAYFMQNDTALRRTHTVKPTAAFSYPACTGAAHGFYTKRGLCIGDDAAAERAFDLALAWEYGAAEVCFPEGLSLAELDTLDGVMQKEAERRGVTLIKRVTAKNSAVVGYVIG